jgi:hypothetical protein
MNFKIFHKNTILQIVVSFLIIHQEGAVTPTFAEGNKNLSNGKSACYVREYESQEKRKCQFPFSITDKSTGETKTFHGCTTYW